MPAQDSDVIEDSAENARFKKDKGTKRPKVQSTRTTRSKKNPVADGQSTEESEAEESEVEHPERRKRPNRRKVQ